MVPQRPLEDFKLEAPPPTCTYMHNIRYINMTTREKNPLGHIPSVQQEAILIHSVEMLPSIGTIPLVITDFGHVFL